MKQTVHLLFTFNSFSIHTINIEKCICVRAVFLNVFFKLPILFTFLKLYIFHILYPSDVLIKIHLTHHLIQLVIKYNISQPTFIQTGLVDWNIRGIYIMSLWYNPFEIVTSVHHNHIAGALQYTDLKNG